ASMPCHRSSCIHTWTVPVKTDKFFSKKFIRRRTKGSFFKNQTIPGLNSLLWTLRRSFQDSVYHIAMHIRQAAVAAVVAEGQLEMIDAEQMQDGRVHVIAVVFVLHLFP